LRRVGITHVWIGGSFVTEKPIPGDLDVVFEAQKRSITDLWDDRELRRAARLEPPTREVLKRQFNVDLWTTDGGLYRRDPDGRPRRVPVFDAWQLTIPDANNVSERKGIVRLDLETLPS